MKLWWHRHPIEGWSDTDYETLTGRVEIGPNAWGISVVDTPAGFVGVYDEGNPNRMVDLPVVVAWPYGDIEANLELRYGAEVFDCAARSSFSNDQLEGAIGSCRVPCHGFGGQVSAEDCCRCDWSAYCWGGGAW